MAMLAAPVVHRDDLGAYARVWAVQRALDMVLGGNQTLFEATNFATLETAIFAVLLIYVGVTGSVRAQLVTAICIMLVTFVKAPFVRTQGLKPWTSAVL